MKNDNTVVAFYFTLDGNTYKGTKADALTAYNNSIKGKATDIDSFETWCSENLEIVIDKNKLTKHFPLQDEAYIPSNTDNKDAFFLEEERNPFPLPKENKKADEGEVMGFTKGDWRARFDALPDITIWNEKECIATVWANDKTEANAALIAAAPEMYNALEELIQHLEWREDFVIEDEQEGNENCYTKAKAIINRINQKA